MTSFTSWSLPEQLESVEALDKIATERCGIVGHSSGYSLTDPVPSVGDWGFQWVNTRGTGNCGTLVLFPLSKRARAVAFNGKAKFMSDATGVDLEIGKVLAACPVSYKFEEEVLELVTILMADSAWRYACEISHSPVWSSREVGKLEVSTHIKDKMLAISARRRETVKALVDAVVKHSYTYA